MAGLAQPAEEGGPAMRTLARPCHRPDRPVRGQRTKLATRSVQVPGGGDAGQKGAERPGVGAQL